MSSCDVDPDDNFAPDAASGPDTTGALDMGSESSVDGQDDASVVDTSDTASDAIEDVFEDSTTDTGNDVNVPSDSTEEAALPTCNPNRIPPDTTEPWVELGTGRGVFESIENCTTLVLVEGIQGGYHIDISLRAGGADLTSQTVRVNLHAFEGDVVIAELIWDTELTPSGALFELLDLQFSIRSEVDPYALSGAPWRVDLDVELPSGGALTDTFTFYPSCCTL